MSSPIDNSEHLTVAIDLRLAGVRRGGIARYGVALWSSLAERPELQVVPLWSYREHREGARLRTPPHHRLESVALTSEMRARRIRADVLHSIDFISPRFTRMARVATVHDLAFLRWPDDLAPDALRYYQKLQASKRWTDGWIVPSQWTAEALRRELGVPEHDIHIAPHGDSLNLGRLPVVPRRDRGDYLLMVGTIEPRKRIDIAIDAVGMLPDALELIVAGSPGWRTEALQRRLGSMPRVRWLRDVNDDALRDLYRNAAAVLVTSKEEGFGLTALEAMAAGTPVISSAAGALREVTGSASIDVTTDESGAWAEAIGHMLRDVAVWERASALGRQRASLFSWERAAAITAAAYLAHAGR